MVLLPPRVVTRLPRPLAIAFLGIVLSEVMRCHGWNRTDPAIGLKMHFQTMREGVYRLAFALMLNVSKRKRVLNGLSRSLSARDAENRVIHSGIAMILPVGSVCDDPFLSQNNGVLGELL